MHRIIISSYGKYRSRHYGLNTLKIKINNLTLYFSYNTIVAFRHPNYGLVVSENVYSKTTGKHLTWIEPNKNKRLDWREFKKKLNEVLKYVFNNPNPDFIQIQYKKEV